MLILYIGLYFTYRNGYYERRNQDRRVLTDEMILEYENDLKNGVDVTKKDYIIAKPNYANVYTRTFLKISKKVERRFDQVIKAIMNYVSKAIDD